MRSWFLIIFLLPVTGFAQKWIGEISPGVLAYNGDLTQKKIILKNFRPALGFDLKYESNDLLNFRVGLMWGMLSADDKNNSDAEIRKRNLSFKTNIYELSAVVEFNFFDPEIYKSYPYIFGGVGIFHFNPYSFTDDGKKVFLQPLSTEGQGLSAFPDRKKYSLTQFCIPFGFGWKWHTKKNNQIMLEFGYRVTFTDYLDDVSKTYLDPEQLAILKSPLAAQMSYRKKDIPFGELNEPRGNSSIKDIYYFSGMKFSFNLKKKMKQKVEKEKIQ
jgi:hypothetical protein